jgi:transposase
MGTECAGQTGMRAYSTDLKERLVRAVANGLPMRAVARRFEVAVTTVKRAVVQQRVTGSLARKPIPGRPRAISREQEGILLARLQAKPDATVLEHCFWWAEQPGQQGRQLSEATMWDGVAHPAPPGLDAYKKSLAAMPCVTRKRAKPGGRRSPNSTRSSSSLSTKAAPTPL